MKNLKWHNRYVALANEVASWSKDPSTRVGAVAIGSKGQVLAQGYNGFPRGIEDRLCRYNNRELKYRYVVHAEMNVIYNDTYNGVSLDGSTLYVSGLPVCSECAKGVIQVGISKVVINVSEMKEPWKHSWEISKEMFDESNIKWEIINDRS